MLLGQEEVAPGEQRTCLAALLQPLIQQVHRDADLVQNFDRYLSVFLVRRLAALQPPSCSRCPESKASQLLQF